MTKFKERPYLLRPVARHPASDGEDPHLLVLEQSSGEVLQVEERVEAKLWSFLAGAETVGKSVIESQFRVRESGYKDGDLLLKSRLKDSPAGTALVQGASDLAVELVGAQRLIVVPSLVDGADDLLHVVQIGLRLERVIDAVVSGLVQFHIVHLGVVAEVLASGSLDQPVGHQRAGGDDGMDEAMVDQIGDDQALLRYRHRAGKGHDDETVFVAGHGFKHVGAFADLASGEGGVAHRCDQVIDAACL